MTEITNTGGTSWLYQFPRRLGRRALRMLRSESRQDLFWSRYEPRNFGDWIGPYLYRAIAGQEPTFARPSSRSMRTVYMAAGSIVRHAAENSIVWGSGIISRGDRCPQPHRILAVRGPHTQRRMHELGYECPSVFGDPALLLPDVYTPVASVRRRLGIVPHFVDLKQARALFERDSEVYVIDVTRPVKEVVDDIVSCEGVVSSSLHGLIVAHAFGVPAAWIEFSDGLEGDGVKFADHYGAGGVDAILHPYRVGRQSDTAEFEGLLRDVPQPDFVPLRRPLMEACPFPRFHD